LLAKGQNKMKNLDIMEKKGSEKIEYQDNDEIWLATERLRRLEGLMVE